MIAITARGDLAKLQKLSGVNSTTIARIIKGETRNPGIETVKKIQAAAKELGLSLDQPSEKTAKKQSPSRHKKRPVKAGRGV